MSLTNYTLPTISREFGTYKLTFQVESASLTAPTVETVVSIGTLRESVDSIPGIIEAGNVTIEVVEDYTTHTYGFYRQMLEPASPYTDDVRLKIELDEGSGYSVIFWGKLDRASTEYNDHYLSDGKGSTSAATHKRTMRIAFVDLMVLLKEVTMGNLATEILTHKVAYYYNDDPTDTATGGASATFTKMQDIIASMVTLAFGQTFSSSYCSVLNSDISYISAHGTETYVGFGDIYLMTSTVIGYFASANTRYVVNRVASAFDYLQLLCKNFGVIARHRYDGSNHIIEIMTRGQSYNTFITFSESPTDSRPQPTYSILPESFYYYYEALAGGSSRYDYWYQNGVYTQDSQPREAAQTFDIEQNLEFTGINSALYDSMAQIWFLHSGAVYAVNTYRYYDYLAGSNVYVDRFDKALTKYMVNRFATYRAIKREYATLSATESSATAFTNLAVLKRHQDNDGGGAKNYFAKTVEKDLDNGSTVVEWINE